MKKLLSIMALFACIAANATTLDLSLTDLSNGWSSSYDATTQTITFSGDWGHRGWNLSNASYSDYNYFVLEIGSATTDGAVYIYYGDNSESNSSQSSQSFSASTSSQYVVVELTSSKTSISTLDVVGNTTGTVTINSAFFTSSENAALEYAPIEESDKLSSFGTLTDGVLITTASTDWCVSEWWAWLDASSYSAVGFELAEALTEKISVKISYGESSSSTDEKETTEPYFDAGTTILIAPLSETYSYIRYIQLHLSYDNTETSRTYKVKRMFFVKDGVEAYTRTVTSGNFGTICLPKDFNTATAENATFYSIDYKTTDASGNPTSITLVEETGILTAGSPYIFKSSGTDIAIYQTGTAAETAGSDNGLVGSFTEQEVYDASKNYYGITNNTIKKFASGGKVRANGAYIDMDAVSTESSASSSGKSIVDMTVDSGTTGIASVQANLTEGSQKIYNLAGQRLSAPQKGINIINGRKVVIR